MNIKINYANASKEDFGEEFSAIMNLLQEFGSMSHSSFGGLAQFSLKTSRRREEVVEALKKLRLKGEIRINPMEEEDADQQYL